MDPLTHTLTGLALARAGANRLAAYATATLVVAANIPDIDYLHILGGTTAYVENRYGWSHSWLGAAALGGGVALAFWLRAGSAREPARFAALGKLLLAGWLGILSHLLLDWSTSAGALLLWPLKKARYALDWFSLVDLWLVTILLLGFALAALFHLIAEEIGARRSPAGVRRGIRAALLACALLVGARATLHSEALAHLDSRLYSGRSPIRVAAFPTPLNPFRWHGVVETDTTFETGEVSVPAPPNAFNRFSTYYKPSASPALEAALATRTARVFLSWARFPLAEVIPAVGGGWRIRMQDLRYSNGVEATHGFEAWIELDTELKLVEESLGSGQEGN